MSVHSPYCDTRRGGACSCRGQADRDIAYLETLQPGESSHITNDSDVPIEVYTRRTA